MTEIELIVNEDVPLFVSVIPCDALGEPTDCAENVRLVGEKDTPAANPVPVRGTVCGLPLALSVMEIVAFLAPAARGVNVTLIMQFAAAFKLAGQLLFCAKSPGFAPAKTIDEIVRTADPLLVNVTD